MKYALIIIYGLLCFLMGVVFGNYVNAQQAEIVSVSATVERTPLDFTKDEETMTIRWVSDPTEVRAVLDKHNADNADKNMVMALSMSIGTSCVVYALEPEYENDRRMQILGHEVLHCFRGKLHE